MCDVDYELIMNQSERPSRRECCQVSVGLVTSTSEIAPYNDQVS
jgi:hypothetical protein